ncbi:MAG: hypothetical protein ACLQBX_03455 [Candidatus Limnocylindrales bacterium]
MRRSGFLGILFFGLVALVAGLVGYQLGLASHAVALGATDVVVSGFLGFGFLLFLLSLGFALPTLVAGGQRGPWGPMGGHGRWAGRMGPSGPGGFGRSTDRSDPRSPWIADLHRSLHEDDQSENCDRLSRMAV